VTDDPALDDPALDDPALDDPALDDAIQVATVRTASAQTEVVRSFDATAALPEKTEAAVNRAEDLHVLAEEAAGEPDAAH
jgi:hypothetical protein